MNQQTLRSSPDFFAASIIFGRHRTKVKSVFLSPISIVSDERRFDEERKKFEEAYIPDKVVDGWEMLLRT